MPKPITAAMLVIGDEILSGRTKDRNIGHLADMLTAVGIDLCEARIVADQTDDIVDAVNALRTRYTYVFTSGGIGPTHDDITADAIAKAFGVPCDYDARAYAMLDDTMRAVAWISPTRASEWPACRPAPSISTIRSPWRPAFASATST